MKTLRRVGRPKAGEGNDSNRSISAGAGPAYLAARLRREDPAQIEAVIRDDPEALVMYREAMKGQHGGDRKSESIKRNNITLDSSERGTSRAYSISLVQRECDAPTVAAVMAGEIKAAGNAKRAAAAKGNANAAKSKTVADHSEQPPSGGKAVAREARAAEARVSPATMGRAEQIGRKRPVSVTRTSKTPGFSKFWFR